MFWISLVLFISVCLWLGNRYLPRQNPAPVVVHNTCEPKVNRKVGAQEVRGATMFMIR